MSRIDDLSPADCLHESIDTRVEEGREINACLNCGSAVTIVYRVWAPECEECGHAGHDPEQPRCTVIWMGSRCDCGERCRHLAVSDDADGVAGGGAHIYFCEDCDAQVILIRDDEGNGEWEEVE